DRGRDLVHAPGPREAHALLEHGSRLGPPREGAPAHRKRPHAVAVVDRGVLDDHRADRVADERRALDLERVEHAAEVLRPLVDGVGAGGLVAEAAAALVVCDPAVAALAARGELAPPRVDRAAEPVHEEDDGTVAPGVLVAERELADLEPFRHRGDPRST